MRLGHFALALALACAAPASAQDAPGHEPPPEALALYQHGRELYRQGHYREAAAELERALTLDPASPNLVYNVARVHELLGELPDAISYYERYLTVLPADDTEERERTQGTIRRLQGAQHEVGSHRPVLTGNAGELRDVGPEVRIEHGVADEIFWATAIGSGLLIVGAAILGGLAVQRDADVFGFMSMSTDPSERATWQGLVDDTHTFALAADVLGIIGGVGALSAMFLYFLRDRIVEAPRASDAAPPAHHSNWPRASVQVDGRRALFLLEGSF